MRRNPYPSIGERVALGDDSVMAWTVKAITERGDVILRGPRLDEIIQAPVEAIRRVTPDQIRTALLDLDALGHGRADRAQAWLTYHFGEDFQQSEAVAEVDR